MSNIIGSFLRRNPTPCHRLRCHRVFLQVHEVEPEQLDQWLVQLLQGLRPLMVDCTVVYRVASGAR